MLAHSVQLVQSKTFKFTRLQLINSNTHCLSLEVGVLPVAAEELQ